DLLVGDSSYVLVGESGHATTLQAGLKDAADDFRVAVQGMGKFVKGVQQPLDFTTSRDTLAGGDGNDRLVGDFSVAITVAVDVQPSGAPDWLPLVHLSLLTITGAADTL